MDLVQRAIQVNIAITFLDPLSFGIGFTLMTAGMLSRTRQGEGSGQDDERIAPRKTEHAVEWAKKMLDKMTPGDTVAPVPPPIR